MFCQLQLLSLHCSVGSDTGGDFKRLLSGALSEGLMIQFEAFCQSNRDAVYISQCSLYSSYLIGLFLSEDAKNIHDVHEPVDTFKPQQQLEVFSMCLLCPKGCIF